MLSPVMVENIKKGMIAHTGRKGTKIIFAALKDNRK